MNLQRCGFNKKWQVVTNIVAKMGAGNRVQIDEMNQLEVQLPTDNSDHDQCQGARRDAKCKPGTRHHFSQGRIRSGFWVYHCYTVVVVPVWRRL